MRRKEIDLFVKELSGTDILTLIQILVRMESGLPVSPSFTSTRGPHTMNAANQPCSLLSLKEREPGNEVDLYFVCAVRHQLNLNTVASI